MFSQRADHEPFFIIQSGVALWEKPKPLASWRWKTISICSMSIGRIATSIFAVVESRPRQLANVFRFHIAVLAAGIGPLRKRQILASFAQELPGFARAEISTTKERVSAVAQCMSLRDIDLRCISGDASILLETDRAISSARALCQSLDEVEKLGNGEIARILDRAVPWAALGIIEMEHYVVAQLVASSQVALRATDALSGSGLQRVHDVRRLPEHIANLR